MARTFDEVDDHLIAADDAAYSLPGSGWTISVWVRVPDNAGNFYKYFLSWGPAGVANSINLYIDEDQNAGNPGRVTLNAFSANGTNMEVSGTAQPFFQPAGNWRHLAFRYTGAQTEIWVDGVLSDSTAGLEAADGIDRADSLYFGGRSDLDADRFFGGDIAEPAIWSTPLSQSEIEALAAVPPSAIDTAPATWWRLLGDAAPEPNEITGVPAATVNGATKAASHPVTEVEGFYVPREVDFTLQGTALSTGGAGAWDAEFPFGTPGSVIDVEGTLHLYYIGADGARVSDGGPAHRKIGLATSTDGGATWTKHAANPLLAHSPNGDEEEGFWRAVAYYADGTVHIFATALTGSGGSVRGDIRYYSSADGITGWTDHGVVVAWTDTPGADEQAVASVWKRPSDGEWFVFYSPKGQSRAAAYAHGPSPTNLLNKGFVTNGELEVSSGSQVIDLEGGDRLLVPIRPLTPAAPRFYETTKTDPLTWQTGPEEVTGTDEGASIALYLDEAAETWHFFMADAPTAVGWADVVHYTAPLRGQSEDVPAGGVSEVVRKIVAVTG